jgi:spore germination protein
MILMNNQNGSLRCDMKPFFLFIICFFVFITGCTSQRIIDKIQIVESISYDRHEDKFKGTAIYPTYEEKGKVVLNILKTESESYADILPRLNSKSTYPIEIGQLRMVLFGNEFAKQGIETFIKNLERDPNTGSRMQLGVAEDKAESILETSKKLTVPFHLSDKIDQNIKNGNLPKMNLHILLEHIYGEGRDPYLPYFIQEEGEVKIDGLALFKKGKYIDYINLRQAFIVKILMDGTQNGQYQIKIKENQNEGFILLKNLEAKAKYTINQIDRIPNISIDLIINAQIKAAPPWVNLTGDKNILKMENIVDEHFKKEVYDLISLLQELKVDPLGLGDRVRAKSRNWDYEHFQDIYPQLKITVNTKVKIIQTGILQ